jgi:hypothetical protein
MKPGDLVVLREHNVRTDISRGDRQWVRENIANRTMLVIEPVNTGFHYLLDGNIFYFNGDWTHLMTIISLPSQETCISQSAISS